MKLLRRNTTEFEYLPESDETSDLDEQGRHTGEYYPVPGTPVSYRGNISTPSGKTVAFGNTPKRRQKRTPDSLANDQRFKFDDIEHDAPAPELEDWEGERVNRNLNAELSRGHVDDD